MIQCSPGIGKLLYSKKSTEQPSEPHSLMVQWGLTEEEAHISSRASKYRNLQPVTRAHGNTLGFCILTSLFICPKQGLQHS